MTKERLFRIIHYLLSRNKRRIKIEAFNENAIWVACNDGIGGEF